MTFPAAQLMRKGGGGMGWNAGRVCLGVGACFAAMGPAAWLGDKTCCDEKQSGDLKEEGAAPVLVIVEVAKGAVAEESTSVAGVDQVKPVVFPCPYGKAAGVTQDDGGSVGALITTTRPLKPGAAVPTHVVSSIALGSHGSTQAQAKVGDIFAKVPRVVTSCDDKRQITLLVSDADTSVNDEGKDLSDLAGLAPNDLNMLSQFLVKLKHKETRSMACLESWTGPEETAQVVKHLRENHLNAAVSTTSFSRVAGGFNKATSVEVGVNDVLPQSDPEDGNERNVDAMDTVDLADIPLTELLRELVKRGEEGG